MASPLRRRIPEDNDARIATYRRNYQNTGIIPNDQLPYIPSEELNESFDDDRYFNSLLYDELFPYEDVDKPVRFDEDGNRLLSTYSDEEIKSILQKVIPYNEEQLAAIWHEGGRYIKAVAGCGKTATLSGLIFKYLAQGIDPMQIGMTSYTKAGANTIKARIQSILQSFLQDEYDSYKIHIPGGTLHHVARQELMRCGHAMAGAKIIDEEESYQIWVQAFNFSRSHERFNTLEGDKEALDNTIKTYGTLRDKGLSPENAAITCKQILISSKQPYYGNINVTEVCNNYEKIKKEGKRGLSMDYTDLLACWLELFTTHPDMMKGRWKKFLVDEFQDTSYIQIQILKKIYDFGSEIIICGDPNQSI